MNPASSNGGFAFAKSSTDSDTASAAKPARSRLRRACAIAAGSMSEPAMRGGAPRAACACRIASPRSRAQSASSCASSFSKPKGRAIPGAMSSAVCAASITIVPAPQKGS